MKTWTMAQLREAVAFLANVPGGTLVFVNLEGDEGCQRRGLTAMDFNKMVATPSEGKEHG